MKDRRRNIKIVFLGRFPDSHTASGPENTAELIFLEHIKQNNGTFIQYFFDGRKHSLSEKLFGEKYRKLNGAMVYTCGLVSLYRKLKSIRPDIIHIITFERFAIIAFLYRIFNRVRIIYSCHGVIAHENKIKKLSYIYRLKDRITEKIFTEKSDRIHSVSENTLKLLSVHYKFNDFSCAIIANPVSEIFYCKTNHTVHDSLNAVVIAKNIFGRSGIDFLQEFLKIWNKPMRIFLLCDLNLNLSANPAVSVISHPLLGRKELAVFYKDKHIFFSLNDYDTFSVATAEAMASGLIPIVTETTGISRYIENGKNGFTVKYGDVEKLTDIVTLICSLSNPERAKISMKASEIINELSAECIYRNYRELYTEVLG